MDRVEIPHDGNMPKFNIEPMPAWGLTPDSRLMIRCACGLVMGLDGHTVEANGDVNPSLWHDEPECGWHVMGRLLDWDGNGST